MASKIVSRRHPNMWTGQAIKDLRKGYGENQEEFAARIRTSIGTLRDWEQERCAVPGICGLYLDRLAKDLKEEKKPQLQTA
jgi:DNA-binding transcriptional regulator YiaG